MGMTDTTVAKNLFHNPVPTGPVGTGFVNNRFSMVVSVMFICANIRVRQDQEPTVHGRTFQ
jgi:hypothetical protein